MGKKIKQADAEKILGIIGNVLDNKNDEPYDSNRKSVSVSSGGNRNYTLNCSNKEIVIDVKFDTDNPTGPLKAGEIVIRTNNVNQEVTECIIEYCPLGRNSSGYKQVIMTTLRYNKVNPSINI